MNTDINKFLNVLQIGIDDIDIINKAIGFLRDQDSDFLSQNRENVAALFYQILCSIQRVYGNEAATNMGEETVLLFEHISNLNTDEDTRSKDSNMMTIWFLNELYRKAKNGKSPDISSDENTDLIEVLVFGLNDINYIFKIEKGGERVFPINRLILTVIKDEKFISMSSVTPYHIRMFQLAIELFNEENEQDVLKQLTEQYNLEFLNYIDGTHMILDTPDFLNYHKNGVMIFYNSCKKSLLIRHEKKEYFFIDSHEPKIEIKEEFNSYMKTIGYYVVIDANGIELVNPAKIMLEEKLEILKLIYDKGYYNIFYENALCMKESEVFSVNQYAVKDRYIISSNSKKDGYWGTRENIDSFIKNYRMMAIKKSGIDMVTFGLCQELLEYDNIGVAALGLDDFSEEDWMQNQIIRNWVIISSDNRKSLLFILKKWCKELEYCKKNDISQYKIKPQSILPYSVNLGWIYEFLGMPTVGYSIYYGTIETDDEGQKYFNINHPKTMAGKEHNTESKVNIDDIVFSEDEIAQKQEYVDEGSDHYIIYDKEEKKWKASILNEEYYRCLALLEMISVKCIPFELRSVIDTNAVNFIGSLMKLHDKALMLGDDECKLFVDFDSMVIYRLIHNLIWSKITAKNWHVFYKIMNQHQKLDFGDILEDEIFKRKEENTLYVPKDTIRLDGTLYRTYCEYMLSNTGRSRHNPYTPKVTFCEEDQKYYINGNLIKKITFLFDNTCMGSSTAATVAFYLNREEIVSDGWGEDKRNKRRNSLVTYSVSDRIVSVDEIIKANEIDEFFVYSYYGTDEGVKYVENVLRECGCDNIRVLYGKKITKHIKDIREDVNKIWKEDVDDDFYTFIREFNQPKKNAFPEAMLNDARNAICLFVKKKELN